MKINLFFIGFLILNTLPIFCGGLTESDLVNTQEITLENVDTIDIVYSWENITLLEGNTDTLIFKEYMSIDNSKYYARISNSGNTLFIKKGDRPFGIGTGILFNRFNARVEIYLPVSYTKDINVKVSSGRIKLTQINGNLTAESSSGSITGDMVNGNANIHTRSGNIIFDNIDGAVSAKATSGRIELRLVAGGVTAEASSGHIQCTVTENTGDVSLKTSSGSIELDLPRNLAFNFTSKTSSGHLTTPFSEKLFSPVSDRKSVQGIIGREIASNNNRNINIRTKSGSIKINWIN